MNITYRIYNDKSELDSLLDQIQILEKKWSLPRKTSAEINLVLDELITNIIKHSDCDQKQPIDITLTKIDLKLTIQIVDCASPFDPTLCKLPDTSLPLEKRKCGGLGVLLIRQFSDCWDYTRSEDRNILTLQKILPKECG
jgi:serine/threonine-protein kinase RsbW